MARLFYGVADKLSVANAAVADYPFTMSCKFFSSDLATEQTLMNIGTAGSGSNNHRLSAAGAAAGDPLSATSRTSSSSNAITTTGYTANTWHHACAVFSSASSRAVFIDGGSKGENGTSGTPTGFNETTIGNRSDGGNPLSGAVAEAAIWNIALTDDEVLMLANGLSPIA